MGSYPLPSSPFPLGRGTGPRLERAPPPILCFFSFFLFFFLSAPVCQLRIRTTVDRCRPGSNLPAPLSSLFPPSLFFSPPCWRHPPLCLQWAVEDNLQSPGHPGRSIRLLLFSLGAGACESVPPAVGILSLSLFPSVKPTRIANQVPADYTETRVATLRKGPSFFSPFFPRRPLSSPFPWSVGDLGEW